jgi:hypothetical protein
MLILIRIDRKSFSILDPNPEPQTIMKLDPDPHKVEP